jgi:hypothetical protein
MAARQQQEFDMGYLKVAHPTATAVGGLNAKPRSNDFDGLPVTPADATTLPNGRCRGVYVTGTTGDIAGTTPSGATVVLTGVPINTIVMIELTIIAATNTTATGILALY